MRKATPAILSGLLIFLPLGAAWAAGSAPTFSAVTTYTVGTAPRETSVGDLNNDGFPDIVSADSSSNRVSVLLGKGDGTFNTAYSAGTVANARSTALADFNKDGKLDIVATGSTASATVLTNDGASTPAFTATAVTISSSTVLRSVVTGDFNADTRPDFAASGYNANKVGVRLNDGAGGFTALAEYSTGTNPTGLVAADMTADGKPDLVSFNRNGAAASSTVTVLVNGGSGTFTPTNYGMGPNPDFGAAGDLNGDGKTDIVAANTTSTAGLTVGLNDGTGVLTKGTTYALPSGPSTAEGASLADMNRDGKLDAVVAVDTTSFALYLGNGDGTFEAGTLVSTGTAKLPYGATTADLNADTTPDVILTGANGTPNTAIGVLLNTTPTPPAAPTNLSALPGDSRARLSFTAPAGSVSNYQYSTDNGSSWTAFSPAVTASPVTITGLTNATGYQVKLRAVNAAGTGTASSAVSVTPSAKPPAPRSPSAGGGALSWSAPDWASTPTAYIVAYKKWADRDNASVPWAVYASRGTSPSATFAPSFSVPTQVNLNASRRACGSANTVLGWTNCPLALGFGSISGGYAMKVYALNGSTAGPMSTAVQVQP